MGRQAQEYANRKMLELVGNIRERKEKLFGFSKPLDELIDDFERFVKLVERAGIEIDVTQYRSEIEKIKQAIYDSLNQFKIDGEHLMRKYMWN